MFTNQRLYYFKKNKINSYSHKHYQTSLTMADIGTTIEFEMRQIKR